MQLKSRFIALPLAAVLASGALFSSSAPAQAAPKSKLYKGGAIALGVLGAYMLSKGKTLEGAAAIGGGVLAYKQGEKERKNEKYEDRYGRYDGRNDNNRNDNNRNDNNRNDNGRYNNNGSYGNGGYNNGGYNNNNGAYYNGNASYNNGSDYRYNDDNSDRDCQEEGNGRGRDNGQYRSNGRSWQR